MNAFLSTLDACGISKEDPCLKRSELTTLQINMGNLCNQNCAHCHVGASPQGNKVMSREVIDSILKFLSKNKGLVLDITGGAPELNPNFDYFIVKARPSVKEIIVRSNLTVLYEKGKEYLPEFYKENNVHLICSLPCYGPENVDAQRGEGVFKKSVEALKRLNNLGYAKSKDLRLDLVYNPNGAKLPPQQIALESDYRRNLKKDHQVDFSRLITITNVPIKRFKDYLDSRGEYSQYIELLKDNFNPSTVCNIMCRNFLSVGYDGKLYDCDFNQSLGWVLKDKKGDSISIETLSINALANHEIMVGEHCLSCTAGYGSSCQGALAQKETSYCGSTMTDTKESVKEYYGKILKTKDDLKTSACCAINSFPKHLRSILSKIDSEILDKFYGCGSPIPPVLKDCTVLDLGCGTGRDTYIVSYLVGDKGRAIGVDMTDEQLEVALKHQESQSKIFRLKGSNTEFKKGYIENLEEIGIQDNSIDVIVSNCVINLSPDKPKVFSEIFRVLKPGGELYFSDVFTGRKTPNHLQNDPVLYAECLGGALYIEDFRRILRAVGCLDYRVVSNRKIALNSPELQEKAGMIDFYSMTIRAFKLPLEDICEDYGQVAKYLGTIPEFPHQFILDDHHIFATNKPMLVCGNTAAMLQETRYSKHFRIDGDRSSHFGPFNRSPLSTKIDNHDPSIGGSCC